MRSSGLHRLAAARSPPSRRSASCLDVLHAALFVFLDRGKCRHGPNPRAEGPRRQGKGRGEGLLDLQRPAQGVCRGEESPASRWSSCCAASPARSASSSTTTWSIRTSGCKPLLDKFVRVRVVSTNGLDLSLFQFDTDQSFAVFLLNADGTIYGRFGTRSDQPTGSTTCRSKGWRRRSKGRWSCTRTIPQNKAALAAKRGPRPSSPRRRTIRRSRTSTARQLNYEGNVVQSCIHCHQIGDAQRQMVRDTERRSCPTRCCSRIRIRRASA